MHPTKFRSLFWAVWESWPSFIHTQEGASPRIRVPLLCLPSLPPRVNWFPCRLLWKGKYSLIEQKSYLKCELNHLQTWNVLLGKTNSWKWRFTPIKYRSVFFSTWHVQAWWFLCLNPFRVGWMAERVACTSIFNLWIQLLVTGCWNFWLTCRSPADT